MNNIIRTKYWNRIEYTLNGILHRENGPSIVTNAGGMYWHKDGIKHREDGPAYIGPSGLMLWYINGKVVKIENQF